MKRNVIWVSVAAVLVLAAQVASAQVYTFPPPSDTPGTTVLCSTCDPGNLGLPIYPYADPLRYTGRYLDSVYTNTMQQPFRTARAVWGAYVSRQSNRVYMVIGSAVAVYNLDTFFTRLAARPAETLMPVTAVPVNWQYFGTGRGPVEKFLKWDKWFYAENTPSGWWIAVVDGQDRLMAIDNDDRGYIYIATSVFGWGILYDDGKSDGGFLQSNYQSARYPAPGEISGPNEARVFKSSSNRYYVTVSGGSAYSNVWDVTNPKNPVRKADTTYPVISPAKTTDRVAFITPDSQLRIYSIDGLVSGQPPLESQPPSGKWASSVTTDGTNFYVYGVDSTNSIIVTKYVPNADRTHYAPVVLRTGKIGSPGKIHYDSGYITLQSSRSVYLYRVTDVGLVEIPLNDYIGKYYNGVSGYAAAGGDVYNVVPVVKDGRLYLIVSGFDLGDVYEVRTADGLSVAAATGGPVGTPNLNAPARTSTVFYGDIAQFSASSSTTTPQVLQWDFGNPNGAAGGDPITSNTATTTLTPGAVSTANHQYSGVTKPTCSVAPCAIAPFTVGVSGGPSSTLNPASLSFTTAPPQVRLGVTDGVNAPFFKYIDSNFLKYLVAQPNASAPIPIVVGDYFVDASDGDTEGHYDTWAVDGGLAVSTAAYADATRYTQQSVGACGAHTLAFAGHYGPYNRNTFTTLLSTNGQGDYPVTLPTFNYNVNAVSAAVKPDPSNGLLFHSASRITSDTSTLSAALAGSLGWQWDLVDGNLQPIPNGAGPKSSGTSPTWPPSDWAVDKSLIQADGLRVRLTVYLPAGTAAPCGMTLDELGRPVSRAYSDPLARPVATLKGTCDASMVCHFYVDSAGADMSLWTFKWTTSPVAAINTPPTSCQCSTFDPIFTTVGTYNEAVSVDVSNAIGTTSLTTTFSYNKQASQCGTMTLYNVFPIVTPAGTCPNGKCPANTPLQFDVGTDGTYNLGCDTHQFSWDFGDNTPSSSLKNPTHPFAASPTPYTVRLRIKNSTQDWFTTSPLTLTAASSTPIGQCGSGMTSANIYPVVAIGACPSSTCPASTPIQFNIVTNGYNLSCDTHYFDWNFGDGTAHSTLQNPTHAFAPTNGSYSVVVKIRNSTQQFTTDPLVLRTSGGSQLTCGPMNSSTLSVAASPSQCPGNVCPPNTPIYFTVQASNGYNLSCANHTFTWDFGDGTAPVSGASTFSHPFAVSSTPYQVKVTISNGTGAPFTTLPVSIQVRDTTVGCPTMTSANVYPIITPAGACPGWTCQPGQIITLQVDTSSYTFACSTHTFTWDFGDGKPPVLGTNPIQHAFAPSATPYLVKVTIANTWQTFTTTPPLSITVKPTGNPATSTTPVSIETDAVGAGVYKFTPVIASGLGVKFHWDLRLDGAATPIEEVDKYDATAFQPTSPLALGKSYRITVTVDDAAVNSIVITPTPPRRRSTTHT